MYEKHGDGNFTEKFLVICPLALELAFGYSKNFCVAEYAEWFD